MDRFPIYEQDGYKYGPGKPRPFGATVVPVGVNFSVFLIMRRLALLYFTTKAQNRPLWKYHFRMLFVPVMSLP